MINEMIKEKINYVEEITIGDAWRAVMSLCVINGYDFIVERGSYVGQIRRQLPFVIIRIIEPWKRPLSPIMPPNLPLPTTDEGIESYFIEYIMGDELHSENETYVYGSFIKPQLPKIIELLIKSNGNTNQSCITIGDKDSISLSDPPCLKIVDFKIVNRKLNMTVYFRSWDLFAGLPQNLGGLQLLKEYVLACLQEGKLEVTDGDLIAYSAGLHIYEQYFSLVNNLNVNKIKIGEDVLADKKSILATLSATLD